ncbi:hypothetical protein DFQ02_102115 [Seonamhaeicola aphaedonensis]|uniref:Uncharacterized protein n=1 Tax=Seonamhaeicola aphaedonensis TaxID=1461338 RepID=A0A3D9HIM3_9FLAO|nr:hypothetical protein DFQ02_102115 [Seonamhaeicola aphaedonensis]
MPNYLKGHLFYQSTFERIKREYKAGHNSFLNFHLKKIIGMANICKLRQFKFLAYLKKTDMFNRYVVKAIKKP